MLFDPCMLVLFDVGTGKRDADLQLDTCIHCKGKGADTKVKAKLLISSKLLLYVMNVFDMV